MPRTGEAPHIGSDLGENHLGQAPLDARNRLQALELRLKRAQALRDLLAQLRNGVLETVDMRELLLDEEAVVGGETALQGLR